MIKEIIFIHFIKRKEKIIIDINQKTKIKKKHQVMKIVMMIIKMKEKKIKKEI